MLETWRVEGPEIVYTQSGDVSIAYAIHGEGPIDFVFVHGYISNLEVEWDDPGHVAFFTRLGSAGRVIRFDRRGSGLSDRAREVPTLEARMDDLRAVMDAAGSPRAVVVATFEAASMTMLFAATYPERVAGLVLFYPLAKGVWAPDYPFAPTEEEYRQEFEQLRTIWGRPEQAETFLREAAPSVAGDPQVVAWAARMFRQGASPGAALALRRMVMSVDVRDVLPSIRVPTLIAHTSAKREESAFIAERIPGAERVELTGRERVFWLAEGFPEAIVRFARAAWGEPEPDTLLSTILFTDIVGSTAKAAELGDRSWRDLVTRHYALVRAQLDRHRGQARHRRRRVLRDLRRPDPCDPVRRRCSERGARPRTRDPRRAAHWRVRADRREARRDCCEHWCTRRRESAAGRSARLPDSERPRRGLRDRVRGPRRRETEGCPRRVATVRGRQRSGLTVAVPSHDTSDGASY